MKVKHLPLLGLLLFIVSVAFVPGVYATYYYTQTGPDDVEYVSDTEYNAYTFSGNNADYDSVDEYITVYKTQMVKGENNKWTSVRSFQGKAQVGRMHSGGLSINVKTWYSV